ncbi:MAG: hypothetical protein ABFD64_02870 [Armatimonadota bacterium]
MKVKMNYTTVYGPHRYNEGNVYDVDDKTGRVLIDGKMARAVEAPGQKTKPKK